MVSNHYDHLTHNNASSSTTIATKVIWICKSDFKLVVSYVPPPFVRPLEYYTTVQLFDGVLAFFPSFFFSPNIEHKRITLKASTEKKSSFIRTHSRARIQTRVQTALWNVHWLIYSICSAYTLGWYTHMHRVRTCKNEFSVTAWTKYAVMSNKL